MREIKYRQWDEENFTYWGFIDGGFISPSTKNGASLTEPSQQFTGLKDKNGKEIYEGDICRYPWADQIAIANVEYFGAAFGLHGLVLNHLAKDSIEVIGNIYENPELIK